MSDNPNTPALDITAMMVSHICHDIISPVGAIVNGLELLEDENSSDMSAFAMDLIKKSAQQASAKLQFARMAFGMAGVSTTNIDIKNLETLVKKFMEWEKPKLLWCASSGTLPKDEAKLLLNLVLLADTAIPREGSVSVDIKLNPTRFSIACTGAMERIAKELKQGIHRCWDGAIPDIRLVQPVYTALLAKKVSIPILISITAREVMEITATASTQ